MYVWAITHISPLLLDAKRAIQRRGAARFHLPLSLKPDGASLSGVAAVRCGDC